MTSKRFPLQSDKLSSFQIILLFAASSIVIAYPASGSVSKPSVLEFSVAYVDHSYDIPPVYGKDSYTGQTIVKVSGSNLDNRTVDVKIENQPFTLYLDSNNNTIGLYCSIRSKGHFDDWSESSFHVTNGVQALTISVSTLVSIDIGYWGVQQGGQIDFQVAAVSGYPASDAAYCGKFILIRLIKATEAAYRL